MNNSSSGTTNSHLLMAALALMGASWLALVSPNPLVWAAVPGVPSLPNVPPISSTSNFLLGKVEVRSASVDALFNTKKVLHASETNVPLFKFNLQAINNREPLRVQRLYLQIRGPQNTLNNFVLYDEDSRSALNRAVQPNWSAANQGEVQFTCLAITLDINGGYKKWSVK